MYSNAKNYFVVLNKDSISSLFSPEIKADIFENKLKNYSHYSLLSQISKYTFLPYDDKLIAKTINKILRLQYLKDSRNISSDEFHSELKKTTDIMPYVYNKYLMFDDKPFAEKQQIKFINELTTLEHEIYASLIHKYILKINNIPLEKNTIIEYDSLKFNFGKIKANDTVKYYFVYRNIGKIPYIIYNIKTSCQCTVSQWSKKPLPQNQKDSICISFVKETPGIFEKTINIQSNADHNLALQICGEVVL